MSSAQLSGEFKNYQLIDQFLTTGKPHITHNWYNKRYHNFACCSIQNLPVTTSSASHPKTELFYMRFAGKNGRTPIQLYRRHYWSVPFDKRANLCFVLGRKTLDLNLNHSEGD